MTPPFYEKIPRHAIINSDKSWAWWRAMVILPMLHILLSPKEVFTAANAGATARVVAMSLAHSKYKNETTVFGSRLGDPVAAPPLDGIAYHGFGNWRRVLHGNTRGLARSYIAHLHKTRNRPRLIEVHNRPVMAAIIAQAMPAIPVALFLHNDARDIDGARTPDERIKLTRILKGVFFNSDYTRDCFLDGIDEKNTDCIFRTCRLGSPRDITSPPDKDPLIIFAGRMVPDKGALEAAEAIAAILPRHPDWKAAIIGARQFRRGNSSRYEKEIEKIIQPLTVGGQIKLTGHLPSHEVRDYQHRAAIILAPSQWHEPAGLVVLEALASGAALITSNRGGIPEYAEGRAIILDTADSNEIANALSELLDNPKKLKALQRKAWRDYPFTIKTMCAGFDSARDAVIKNRGLTATRTDLTRIVPQSHRTR